MSNTLDKPLSALPGIGSRMLANLNRLGLHKVRDLIYHFPSRYEDFSTETTLAEIEIGVPITLVGQIWTIKNVFTKHGKKLTQAVFSDGTNTINLVWFNSHWLVRQLKGGEAVSISGKVVKVGRKLEMVMPVWEKLKGENLKVHTGRLVPIYPETAGVTSKWFRTRIFSLLPLVRNELIEYFPEHLRGGTADIILALEQIHYPDSFEMLEKARERLAFEELFYIQLATAKVRMEWQASNKTVKFVFDEKWLDEFMSAVGFELTNAQKRVFQEARLDLNGKTTMNRLIQGDVGSGKTVVAAALIHGVVKLGYRAMLMAPTEVLAIQHYKLLDGWLSKMGISVGLQTGATKTRQEGEEWPMVIVGTHALISDSVNIPNVGIVVIDEQHRFGVRQRNKLREMAEVANFLSMTATPVPRTVALVMYGDLDLSIIDEMPKGRQLVKTYLVPQYKRGDAYKFIERKIENGDQVYVVMPLIDESDDLTGVKAAKTEHQNLHNIFPNRRIGLLHGKLKSDEKAKVIEAFRAGDLDILVSTSVVEVGVDVPNATVMVIEGAERFGLASLHQLRGRVGRGAKESCCLLFMSDDNQSEVGRLKALTNIHSGLRLAELDLKVRGSGEVFGSRQSGRFELKVASLEDIHLVEKARESARAVLDEDSRLDKYPIFKLKLDELIQEATPD